MSDTSPISQYQFLPYIRRGLASLINGPDSLTGQMPLRATLNIELDLQSQGDNGQSSSATSLAQINGPGDVTGIIKAHVIRTEPVTGTNNFEPNYFAAIEFDQIDLPWLLTPGAPNSNNQLLPWLALVVLAQGEFDVSPSSSPLPSIVVHNPEQVLPNISELWAWAHVQISGPMPADLNSALKNTPGMGLSRIICPRHLEPSKSYVGFLVPVFDAGQAVGLGNQPPSSTQLGPAWQQGQTSDVTLPVYYGLKNTSGSTTFEFEFQTSDEGDFESLVRRLQRVILPADVGTRPMDVTDPDPTGIVKPPSVQTLDLEGALMSPLAVPSSYPGANPDDFQTTLSDELDLTSPHTYDPSLPDPMVVPPFYGNWYAGAKTVSPKDGTWLSTVNLDPRNRAAAGLGAPVVLGQLRTLLSSAWKQAGDLKKANELLNLAQFSREVLSGIMKNDLSPLSDESILTVTAPVLSRITASPQTVASKIAESHIPPLALSSAFRRVFRPLGSIRRRQQKVAGVPLSPHKVIGDLNADKVKVAPPPGTPNGMTSIDKASTASEPAGIPSWLDPVLPFLFWILLGLGIFAFFLTMMIGIMLNNMALATAIGLAVLGALSAAAAKSRPVADQARGANTIQSSNINPVAVKTNPPQSTFAVTVAGSAPKTVTGIAGEDSPDASAFRAATVQLADWLQIQAPSPQNLIELKLPQERTNILSRLDPAVTVLNRVKVQLNIGTQIVRQPSTDPLGPIMWGPTFPQPMYLPLAEWSQDLLLPGVGEIPKESLAILIENRTFIESYMLGLNVEIVRQLAWNHFTIDMRVTPARQFWDVSGFVPTPSTAQAREALYDIAPIHLWDRSVPLGNHTSSPGTQTASVILLVRGEILKRYPQTQIYAVPAALGNPPNTPQYIIDPNGPELTPIYQGSLSPDLRFFGFNLTADMISGKADSQHPQGWFFVFQQLPGMPRFGLEPTKSTNNPVSWAELSWDDFSFPSDFASPCVHPSFTPNDHSVSQDVNNAWGTNAAQMAYITMRHPERVAYLAKDLLPPANDAQTANLVTRLNNVPAMGLVALERRG